VRESEIERENEGEKERRRERDRPFNDSSDNISVGIFDCVFGLSHVARENVTALASEPQGRLRSPRSLNCQVLLAKEPHKDRALLQKSPSNVGEAYKLMPPYGAKHELRVLRKCKARWRIGMGWLRLVGSLRL